MATSILRHKRGLTEAFGSPSCSPHKIAFLDLADHSEGLRRAKRTAQMMQQEASESIRSSVLAKMPRVMSDAGSRPRRQSASEIEASPFQPSSTEDVSGESLFTDKKVGRSCKQRPGERVYSAEDVREIVQKAVARREGELRAEYDTILQERLADQFNSFRKFHEDYVSQKLNRSEYNYMS